MYDPVNTSVFALFKKTDVLNRFFERNRLRDKTVFEFAFYEHALIFHKLG